MNFEAEFEWDQSKDFANQVKHQVSFQIAKLAFKDPNKVLTQDFSHSTDEKRYYCLGKVKEGILTVRFTYRKNKIRIIGAGYWRKGKQIYEEKNKIHE
ncbi:MAG: BrnT family toxin [Deltaproteobacteria bacterium]|nr:BrnT family toxin [Deltaproteobacteria bacterium]